MQLSIKAHISIHILFENPDALFADQDPAFIRRPSTEYRIRIYKKIGALH